MGGEGREGGGCWKTWVRGGFWQRAQMQVSSGRRNLSTRPCQDTRQGKQQQASGTFDKSGINLESAVSAARGDVA